MEVSIAFRMSEKGGDLYDVEVSHWEEMAHGKVPAYLAIWVTLVSLILNEYMYTSKYAENVLVIIRQDYGI